MTSCPVLLEVLARVPDPRRRRGRRYTLVFMLAVAVAYVLAGAKTRITNDFADPVPADSPGDPDSLRLSWRLEGLPSAAG